MQIVQICVICRGKAEYFPGSFLLAASAEGYSLSLAVLGMCLCFHLTLKKIMFSTECGLHPKQISSNIYHMYSSLQLFPWQNSGGALTDYLYSYVG